ncbi:MAG: LuxR C-terminal-related transcriptional regulator [Bifidobacteriaceae bacterium]|nr:LuxR C-terminal-related transcriptional regulator [Bifidobacteriaceae bacterium]
MEPYPREATVPAEHPAGRPEARPSAAVVDDESLTRSTFRVAYPMLDVVGEYATVEALLAAKPRADIVVLDLLLSRTLDEDAFQGPRAIKRLTNEGYRVCIHTDERRNLVLAQCFAAGAVGLARKSDSLEDNAAAFLRVAAGHLVVPSQMLELAQMLNRRRQLPELTPRQAEVLGARARGEPWGALARRLGISRETAEGHLRAVNAKMAKFLVEAAIDPALAPADVERALGLAPGDLNGPGQ